MCDHIRTEMIARRDGIDYLECLDCHQIFDAEDLAPDAAEEEEESTPVLKRPRPESR
jgi:hypothetical protein